MVTYIMISILIMAFSVIGIKALIKKKRHKRKQLRMAESYDRFVRQFKLGVDILNSLLQVYWLDRRTKMI